MYPSPFFFAVSYTHLDVYKRQITSTSQDIEYYHGVSDGESWSEGSTSKEINFCGVAPGKYHFLISAEKEQGALVYPSSQTEISGRTVTVRPDGLVEVRDAVTGNLTTYGDMSTYKKDSLNFAEFEKVKKKQDSINGLSNLPLNTEPTVAEINPENQNISLKATWLPVSPVSYTHLDVYKRQVSDKAFTRMNNHLRNEWGITVEEIPYREISKMGGLLRCSTLPLVRE